MCRINFVYLFSILIKYCLFGYRMRVRTTNIISIIYFRQAVSIIIVDFLGKFSGLVVIHLLDYLIHSKSDSQEAHQDWS